MAADQTNIVIDACMQISTQATIILDALTKLEKIRDEVAALGIDIASYSTAIEANDSIKHCGASTFKNLINSFPTSLVAAIKGLYDGSPTQQCWGALQIARRVS
jgi:hypothetical protein